MLTQDLWFEIFQYVKTQKGLASTCKLFNDYLNDEAFWRKFISQDFPHLDMKKINALTENQLAKELYKKLYIEKKFQAKSYVAFVAVVKDTNDIDPVEILNANYNRHLYSLNNLIQFFVGRTSAEKAANSYASPTFPMYVFGLNLSVDEYNAYHKQFRENQDLLDTLDLRSHIVQILKKKTSNVTDSECIDKTFVKFNGEQFVKVDLPELKETTNYRLSR